MACSTGARDTGAPALFIVESFLSCSRTTTESRQRNVVSRTNGILGSLLFLLIVGIMVLDITVVGLEQGLLPPRAEVTIINGRVQRDDLYFFQVLTEAWRSTRVRVTIEDCTPRTALIASFGGEPTPSRHELLAPATLDRNGTCGMDVITRPSYVRDGFWHFAVVGGLPLRSQRYFAGPPDTLDFEVAIIAEPVLYPWLDRGLAPPLLAGVDDDDDYESCLRIRASPPVPIPMIAEQVSVGIAAASAAGVEDNSTRYGGNFLPKVGDFVSTGSSSSLASGSRWLGMFTVGAYSEIVVVNFEVAALRGGGATAAQGGNGGYGGGSGEGKPDRRRQRRRRRRRHLEKSAQRGDSRRLLQTLHGQWSLAGVEGEEPRTAGEGLTAGVVLVESAGFNVGRVSGNVNGADVVGNSDGDGGGGGGDGGAPGRVLADGGKGQGYPGPCVVKVCAAATIVPYWDQEGMEGGAPVEPEEGRMVCSSVTVVDANDGEATPILGALELPIRPQAGRWYVTGRASCENSDMPDNPRPLSGDGGGGGGSRGGGQVSIGGNAKPVVVEGGGQSPTRATRPSVVDAVDVDVDNVDVAADGPGFGDGRDDDQMTMGAAISLQRDWAHVEWSGEELLPERQARLEREGSCGLSAAARESGDPGVAETAFVLSAAVVAQSCPSGRVGVDGLGVRRVASQHSADRRDGRVGGEDAGPTRVSCIGEAFPTVMTRKGAAAVYEGRPRALSNFVHSEGKGSEAVGGAPRRGRRRQMSDDRDVANKDVGGTEVTLREVQVGAAAVIGGQSGEDDEGDRWLWEGPGPPSVWYAIDMSGREVGASMTVSLVVNSSFPTAGSSSSVGFPYGPYGWTMGPHQSNEYYAGEGGDRDVLSPVDEASVFLSVAMRMGALPVLDANGTGLQDTWVLHSSHALSEANEVEDPDHYTTAALVSRSSDEQVHPFWSTTYRWNLTHPPPLAGHVWGAGGGSSGGWGLSGAGQAGTSATTATTLFLAVYAECVFTSDHDGSGDGGEGRRGCPRRAEEAGGGGGGGGGGDEEGGAADGLWALGVAPRVEFRYCDKETCPMARSVCRVSNGDGGGSNDYVKASKCYCTYGFGGEACAQRIVSYASIIWQTLLLVGTNLAVVPGVRTALSLGATVGSAPAVVLALNGAASAVYHMCDLELTCAGGILSYHALQALDFFFSFFSVAVLVLHLCPMPWDDPLTVAARNYRSPSPPGATLGAEDTDDPFFTRGALDDVPEKGELDYIVGGTGGGDGSVVGDMYDNLGLDTMRTAVRTHNFYRRGSGASGDVGGGSSRASGTISNRAAMLNNRGSGGAWTGDFRSHGVHHSQGSGQSRRDGANLSSDRASSNDVFEAKEETIGNITRQAAARVGDGGSRGSGTRLASLYVCLIPPLLTAVADSPTAGTNLALVFAVCGGLLAFSWGRLVARDMHDLEAKAAREEWVSSRSVAASAGAAALDSDTDGDNDASAAIGDEEDGGAAEEIDGRENDGKHETRALMCCRDDDSGGGGRGAVGSFRTEGNIISSTIEKMTVATNSSSELRSHEEGEPPYGGNCEERQRGEQRKSDGRGGGGGGSNHDCEAGVLATDNVEASADCGDDETPQRQPDGRTRSASCTDTLSGRNQVSTERSSRMRQSERRATGGGRGEEFWNDVDRCGSAANRNARCRVRSCCGVLGRLQYRAIRRSCKRVIVDGRLVDWRHAGLGAAGFTAGLMCFAAQGKFPAWYHMWHSAWHILAMGSTVPLLRARKWGTSGDYPDTPRGSLHSTLSLHGNDKSPIGVGEHRHKTGRQRKGTSWARWGMFFGAGLGGRVETRASYEMVPN